MIRKAWAIMALVLAGCVVIHILYAGVQLWFGYILVIIFMLVVFQLIFRRRW